MRACGSQERPASRCITLTLLIAMQRHQKNNENKNIAVHHQNIVKTKSLYGITLQYAVNRSSKYI